ncbi:MAG: argininosuccinate synthase [Nitrosopumilus sp.]|nr:argininosuccinate synthase [Nitrosopumilus sp.]CAI9830883.1 Argininosuccinate synthase [Nitrosopumilaceae archaeon]MDA7941290.1 argininosuccinate synthase [Nitrosopumilus sp.]MDA7945309.1 argininosuccinate synthase [Nitrosopumilus sp.]MDA7952781.1 argininosuccinate synthase [Nitrosopumilus sp.]
MADTAVLAFSGGLDTSVAVRYLQEAGMDVVTVTVDVGQGGDFAAVAAKARRLGARRHYNIDARREFVSGYVIPAIKANALYQKKYSLATALARPLIAEKMLKVASRVGAGALAHGCSGKGNDQVRFDVALRAGSDLPIVAPIRDGNLDREEELEFAKKHGIHVEKVAKKYSIDENLWGRAIEGGDIEDAYKEPPDSAFEWVRPSGQERPVYAEIEFRRGVPVRADSVRGALAIIEHLNAKAGRAGVGITDHIEDRTVGIKSREVYEAPAATCLIEAHADLEKMVHTSHQTRFKGVVDEQWAHLAYTGLWQDPLRRDLDAYIERCQQNVTGTVRLRLHRGSVRVAGRRSPSSLYDVGAATYGAGSTFEQGLAAGFAELWGMQSTEAVKLQKKGRAGT